MPRLTKLQQRMAEAYPLDGLPIEMQERIEQQASAEAPPAKWLYFGAPGSFRPLGGIVSRGWYEWHWRRGIDPEGRRPSLPPSLRNMVIERDGYVCQLCGQPVEPNDVHIDHIKPRSKGGPDVLGNLQVTHSLCNMRKAARI